MLTSVLSLRGSSALGHSLLCLCCLVSARVGPQQQLHASVPSRQSTLMLAPGRICMTMYNVRITASPDNKQCFPSCRWAKGRQFLPGALKKFAVNCLLTTALHVRGRGSVRRNLAPRGVRRAPVPDRARGGGGLHGAVPGQDGRRWEGRACPQTALEAICASLGLG